MNEWYTSVRHVWWCGSQNIESGSTQILLIEVIVFSISNEFGEAKKGGGGRVGKRSGQDE
jgi:hypothetical protein